MGCQHLSLREWQQNLTTDIFQKYDVDDANPLAIYQNNLLMTATRSLSISYPVVAKMIGHDVMIPLASRLLKQELPETGDWADWGEELALLIHESELNDQLPMLADMARFEWLMHLAGRRAEVPFCSASLELLSLYELDELTVTLSPSVEVFRSHYPISKLWALHQPDVPDYSPAPEQIIKELENGTPEYLAIAQFRGRPAQVPLDQSEHEAMTEFIFGKSIGHLIDDQTTNFNFIQWLPKAIQNGWITEITHTNSTSIQNGE